MPADDQEPAIVAKYRATWQFKEALKIIEPDRERRRECEHQVAVALFGVEVAAKIDKGKLVRTPAQYKKNLRQLAKTLHRAIDLAAKAIPPEYQMQPDKDSWFGDELKIYLKKTERAIDWINKSVKKGSPRLSLARRAAVDSAYVLLRKYGRRPPTRGREGRWLKLAGVLFGNEQADLFDYLDRSFPYLVETGRIRLEP